MQRSRHFALATAVAIVLVVAAPGTAPVAASSPKNVPLALLPSAAHQMQREVFGFALASSLADPTRGYPSWNFDLLSTVAFFGLHVGSSGQLVSDAGWSTWNSAALTKLVSIAHQHGVKVVLNGQGADETLAGYSNYFHDYWYTLLRTGQGIERKLGIVVHRNSDLWIFRRVCLGRCRKAITYEDKQKHGFELSMHGTSPLQPGPASVLRVRTSTFYG